MGADTTLVVRRERVGKEGGSFNSKNRTYGAKKSGLTNYSKYNEAKKIPPIWCKAEYDSNETFKKAVQVHF